MPLLVAGTRSGIWQELKACDQNQTNPLRLEILGQVQILVVQPQGGAHEADSRALQLLHNCLLIRRSEILKAVDVHADRALCRLRQGRLPCHGQGEEEESFSGRTVHEIKHIVKSCEASGSQSK